MERELRRRLLADFPELASAFAWIDALPWQDRPDGDYRGHLTRVAGRLAYDFGETRLEALQAALLHDCLEDQAERIAADHGAPAPVALESRFGAEVRRLVEALTTHGDYADHIGRTLAGPAARIKFSDFCDNALRLEGLPPERADKLRRKYAAVAPLFLQWLSTQTLGSRQAPLAQALERLAAS